ncbi:MAG: hypothetical protein JWR16_3152 [Nevskia sp.]|nr:hypothetical protein [Nevskia sp.]
MNPVFMRASLLALLCAAPGATFACTSCGCSLGTDWADQGYFTDGGLHLDLRYDFVDQNQLRRGSHKVDKSTLEFPNDDEIQQGTLTRFYTVGADYAFSRDWGINVQLPVLDREHETIDEGETDVATSHTRGIGDLRILARYQGLFADRSTGIQFGLKLPTGAIHDTFNSGPNEGEGIDRGLQNGSGTTDLLLGAYNLGNFGSGFGSRFERFEQIQLKQALNHREQFRPSTQLSLNLALSYTGLPYVTPQLQLNGKFEGREVGAQADYDNSGSRTLYLSPGVTIKVLKSLSAYSFVQLPLYQDYNGYQLAPHYLLSVGLRYAI